MRTAKEQREIRFIYNKHNKSTKYKLEIDDNRIVFPENIRLIINKREKRTNEEAEELKCFREKVLSEMAEESAQIEKTVEMELLKKKRDRIERIRIAQDKRNQNDSSKKKHIGIWITLGSKSRISREHYAEINKKSSLSTPQTAEYYRKHPDKRSELFEDEECSIYTDSYCERHRAKCLENYDNNMMMSIIPILTLLFLQVTLAFFALRSPKFRIFLDGNPSVIIKDGKVNYNEMIKQKYNLDDLLVQLREKGYMSIGDVNYAILESNGTLSVFPNRRRKNDLPLPLILDSKVQKDTLKLLGKNDKWLFDVISKKGIKLDDIFYAFYKGHNLFIIRYDELV